MGNKFREHVEGISLTESLKEEINTLIHKKASVNLNWDKIHRAVNRFGEEYKVEKVNNSTIRVYNSDEDAQWNINIILPVLDFYDDDGNLVSKKEEE